MCSVWSRVARLRCPHCRAATLPLPSLSNFVSELAAFDFKPTSYPLPRACIYGALHSRPPACRGSHPYHRQTIGFTPVFSGACVSGRRIGHSVRYPHRTSNSLKINKIHTKLLICGYATRLSLTAQFEFRHSASPEGIPCTEAPEHGHSPANG